MERLEDLWTIRKMENALLPTTLNQANAILLTLPIMFVIIKKLRPLTKLLLEFSTINL